MGTREGQLPSVSWTGRDKVVGKGFLAEMIKLNHVLIKETICTLKLQLVRARLEAENPVREQTS